MRKIGSCLGLLSFVTLAACRPEPRQQQQPQWQPPQGQGWIPPQPQGQGWIPPQPQPPQGQGWLPPQPQPQGANSALAQPDALSAALADRVNAYRVSRGLPSIPRSRALGIVAATHARDLARNYRMGTTCNLHSWVQGPSWTGCCYTSDHAQAKCMWQKPKELTGFPGNGYEVSAMSTGTITPESALEMWQQSSGHHAVILSQGTWGSSPWRSIGAAIYGGYAVVWFAHEADAAGGY